MINLFESMVSGKLPLSDNEFEHILNQDGGAESHPDSILTSGDKEQQPPLNVPDTQFKVESGTCFTPHPQGQPVVSNQSIAAFTRVQPKTHVEDMPVGKTALHVRSASDVGLTASYGQTRLTKARLQNVNLPINSQAGQTHQGLCLSVVKEFGRIASRPSHTEISPRSKTGEIGSWMTAHQRGSDMHRSQGISAESARVSYLGPKVANRKLMVSTSVIHKGHDTRYSEQSRGPLALHSLSFKNGVVSPSVVGQPLLAVDALGRLENGRENVERKSAAHSSDSSVTVQAVPSAMALQKLVPVAGMTLSHYELAPEMFWQYPQVNSYRVLFRNKYYLFEFDEHKVTSFLEENYDRS
ncbi:hypothetical protein ACODM8_16890 [Vibrio ostreicida]|uniref:hypothetical protein n=1 Tax=Vibrio ostreicida TaxID=526588 RepID=UPI003B59C8A1